MNTLFIKFMITFLFCIALSGCSKENESAAGYLNLAESIRVDCHYNDAQISKTYLNSDKIDVILKYLHQIDPKKQFFDLPQQAYNDYCKIIVSLSNGAENIYELQDKSLYRYNAGVWFTVDQEKANVLYHLIIHIDGDKKIHANNAVSVYLS